MASAAALSRGEVWGFLLWRFGEVGLRVFWDLEYSGCNVLWILQEVL